MIKHWIATLALATVVAGIQVRDTRLKQQVHNYRMDEIAYRHKACLQEASAQSYADYQFAYHHALTVSDRLRAAGNDPLAQLEAMQDKPWDDTMTVAEVYTEAAARTAKCDSIANQMEAEAK